MKAGTVRRVAVSTLVLVAVLAGLAAVQRNAPLYLTYNGTDSIPAGLYLAERAPQSITAGDIVCVSTKTFPAWVQARRYLPASMPMCKVAALAGKGEVSRTAAELSICAGARCLISKLRAADSAGRVMQPGIAEGKTWLHAGQLYLWSPHERGLDSRYLGLIPLSAVQSRLTPVWPISG